MGPKARGEVRRTMSNPHSDIRGRGYGYVGLFLSYGTVASVEPCEAGELEESHTERRARRSMLETPFRAAKPS